MEEEKTSEASGSRPTLLGLGRCDAEHDSLVHGLDQIGRQQVMLAARSGIHALQLHGGAVDVVDEADVLAIGADHLHALGQPGCEAAGKTRPGAANRAVVLDIDLGAAHRVADSLGAVRDVLADADLLDDAGRLADDGLLVDLFHLDRALL